MTETSGSSGAPHELNRLEVLRGLRVATWEIGYAMIWGTLTTGAFLTGFALWLGAGDLGIGVLTAVPTIAGLIQLLSSYFTEKRPERRLLSAWLFTIGRFLWLPILLLPVFIPRASALIPFLLLYSISYVIINIPMPAYLSWMSDLVPPDHRGRYFGKRNMIGGIVGMLVGLPAAWFLDYATKRHHWEAFGFGTLFGIGVFGATLSFIALLRQPEPPKKMGATDTAGGLSGMLAFYKTPLQNKNFVRLMVFNTIFAVAQNFAAPFFTVYALQNLRMDYTWLQIFATMASVASLVSMPLWGYLGDKFGNKPLIAICVFGVFTLPISWLFTSPENHPLTMFLLTELNLAGGLFWAGVGLAQFNLLISMCPPERTSVYVAVMSAVTGVIGGISPLVGSIVMRTTEHWTSNFLGLAWNNFFLVFAITSALRLVALALLRPVADPKAASAREVLEQIGRANPKSWLHIRQLQHTESEELRLQATGALGEAKTRLAVSELQAALTDPSQAVREEAARALGEIGDPAAVDALIVALHDRSAGLTEAAAYALGRIGDRRANAALISVLRAEAGYYTRTDRLLAVRALGELGGPDAADALLRLLEALSPADRADEELAESVVRSLGQVGDERAAPPLAMRLNLPETPRTVRLAVIRSLGELALPESISGLRQALTLVENDPALLPLLSDALARLHDRESAPILVEKLIGLDSVVARKQVAHAIGTLMGQGEVLYGLLSRTDFTRDTAISRLIQEMQRKLRGSRSGGADLGSALDAYMSGSYGDCVRLLDAAACAVPGRSDSETQELCRAVVAKLARLQTESLSTEAALLAILALHGLVIP